MQFYNNASCQVLLTVGSSQSLLMPRQSVDIECDGAINITLKHEYKSTCLSKEEIAQDDMDASLVSALLSSHKPPYFSIVLDSSYRLHSPKDAIIHIQREKIRPTYYCSYDRFYPKASEGNVIDNLHTFDEKQQFEKHYKSSTQKGSKKIIKILLTVLSILSIPIIVLLSIINILLGIIALILSLIAVGTIALASFFVSKLFDKVDYELVLSDFESDKIVAYYFYAKNDSEEKYDLSID